jgi:hypothetical protein
MGKGFSLEGTMFVKMDSKKLFYYFIFLLIVGGCASHSRPTLYPNETLKQKGQAKADEDINQCLKEADEYFKTPEGKKVANGSSGSGAMVGTGVGFGVGPSTSLGVGVGYGTIDRGVSGTEVRRGYVNQCLVNKGYQVLTWD